MSDPTRPLPKADTSRSATESGGLSQDTAPIPVSRQPASAAPQAGSQAASPAASTAASPLPPAGHQVYAVPAQYAPVVMQPVLMQPPLATSAVLALVFGLLFAPLGVIFGHVGLSRVNSTGERGKGLAVAGLVLGYFGVAGAALAVTLSLLGFAQLGAFLSATAASNEASWVEDGDGGDGGAAYGDSSDAESSAPEYSEPEIQPEVETPEPNGIALSAAQLSAIAESHCPSGSRVVFEGESESFAVVICESSGSFTYAGGNAEFGYISLPAAQRYGGWEASNASVTYSVSEAGLLAVDQASGENIVDESMLWSNRFN